MRFAHLLTFVSLASAATIHQKRQQATAISIIVDSVNALKDAAQDNVKQIETLAASINNNVGADVRAQIIADITANYDAVIDAAQTAAGNIVDVTTGAVGGIGQAAQGLTQQQITQLALAIQGSIDVVRSIEVIVKIAVSDLTPDLKTALAEEVVALRAAIAPFVNPLTKFATAVRNASASLSLAIVGLYTAQASLLSIISGLVSSIGLDLSLFSISAN